MEDGHTYKWRPTSSLGDLDMKQEINTQDTSFQISVHVKTEERKEGGTTGKGLFSAKARARGSLWLRMAKNPPANGGDTVSIPGLGRSHMPRGNQTHAPHY